MEFTLLSIDKKIIKLMWFIRTLGLKWSIFFNNKKN